MLSVRVHAASVLFLCALPASADTVKFNRDIRPIMSDTCFRCHGPDAKSRMAGLRLDLREQALKPNKAGVAPIVPGDPEKSAIIQRIFADNPARIMPPSFAHKELTDKQKATIRQWVAEGAQYEGHWAYTPIRRPPVPEVSGGTVRNPIDAFIQERLAREGLKPSAEADRRTLLRRVTLDLNGVPPTPEELDAFVQDKSPDAYEKVVDRLLASPRYAEMQAMRWLDAVRYGDSSGFHGDNLWPAWPYRDYVLRAFRDNMPFDRFTREQIAGDLIPNATVDQKIASAYNRLNRESAEGGLQEKEYLAKYGADRVRTTTTVWLGATMGCAECHDHKFDPFTAKDFYSFKAFFADMRETGLIPDRGVKAWGTKLSLPTDDQKRRLEELDRKLESVRALMDKKADALEERRWAWEEDLLRKHKAGELEWKYQKPISAEAANGTVLKIYDAEPIDYNYYLNGSLASERKRGDGLIVAEGPNPDNDVYTVRLRPGSGTWTSVGLDVYQDESLPGNRLSRGGFGFFLSEVEIEADGKRLPVSIATSTQSGELPEQGAMAAVDGDPGTVWRVGFGEARNPFLAIRLAEPLRTTDSTVLTVRLRHESAERKANIGRFRLALNAGEYAWPESGDSGRKARAAKPDPEAATLSIQVDKGIPPDVLKALETPEEERTPQQTQLVREHFEWAAPEFQVLFADLKRLEFERDLLDASIPRVLVTESMRPRVTRVLRRGNFLDDSGEVVQPAIPAVFGHVETGGKRATRLDLANWIVSKENPLTSRTVVNRTWRAYFGIGLSKVLEDLGSQGELPTHLELLDWLAADFMDGWDMKKLVRTIVTSHTYRQASVSSPALDEKDPDNRLLARQSRFRVDAEIVHDISLAVAGLLKEHFGGPSVRPVQPEGYLQAMNFPKREYSPSHGDDLYRRALYTQWQRTFLHPSLLTFDAPTREECTVNRVNSNTPLQALDLLNDPIFVEAARVFAQYILSEGGTKLDARLDWAFRRALNRAPEKAERKILTDLHRKNLLRFRAQPDDARELLKVGEAPLAAGADPVEVAAMTTVARTILNLHETITRN